jgi:hypothetical protein
MSFGVQEEKESRIKADRRPRVNLCGDCGCAVSETELLCADCRETPDGQTWCKYCNRWVDALPGGQPDRAVCPLCSYGLVVF